MNKNKSERIREISRLNLKPRQIAEQLVNEGVYATLKQAREGIYQVHNRDKKKLKEQGKIDHFYFQKSLTQMSDLKADINRMEFEPRLFDSKYVKLTHTLPALSHHSYFHFNELIQSLIFNTHFNSPDLFGHVETKADLKFTLHLEIDWRTDEIFKFFTQIRDRAINDQEFYTYNDFTFGHTLTDQERKGLMHNTSIQQLKLKGETEHTERENLVSTVHEIQAKITHFNNESDSQANLNSLEQELNNAQEQFLKLKRKYKPKPLPIEPLPNYEGYDPTTDSRFRDILSYNAEFSDIILAKRNSPNPLIPFDTFAENWKSLGKELLDQKAICDLIDFHLKTLQDSYDLMQGCIKNQSVMAIREDLQQKLLAFQEQEALILKTGKNAKSIKLEQLIKVVEKELKKWGLK